VGDVLAGLQVPSHILFAMDDPIIPAADLDQLARTPHLEITRVNRGGHCGFLDSFSGASYADRMVAQLMKLAPIG
jgi:predicted alpha/beta-fold hydrolase